MSNMEGKKVPQVTFRTRQGDSWVDVTSADLFDNKTVVVFSLPGAFTPTCSSSHLPRYNELAPVFKQYGVDDILVISVNDTFVMNAWKEDENAENITFVPDGNGTFTEGMGMLVDKDDLGFGKRSWRYSMLVKNGVVEKCSSSQMSQAIRLKFPMLTPCCVTSHRITKCKNPLPSLPNRVVLSVQKQNNFYMKKA
ncbi:putative hybrid peroxiredoxin hyPrx5 [Haemophilus pittmaniae HK 85]|uniref:Glutathione-dependent peroxiredoxin n=1 Tax=Haemophilus pittmaniae HK 85 TaxID=1035188 RepID=F9Q9F1_9PAST|nr:putative hybrid peroxiredoxin hyPrx5 [Haemophilus pittmaniae HK 85]